MKKRLTDWTQMCEDHQICIENATGNQKTSLLVRTAFKEYRKLPALLFFQAFCFTYSQSFLVRLFCQYHALMHIFVW